MNEAAIAAHAVSAGFVQAKVDTVKLGTAQANLASAQANLREKQADGTTTAEELQVATARVAAAEKAVSDALDGKIPKMDAATKMAVVQDLIMKQSADTLGAHNRELTTAQSKQEQLRAIWANAAATLGESLLPIASTFYDVLGKLIPRLVEVLLPAIGYLSERMQGWAAWVIERMPLVEEAIGRFAQRVIDMWPAVVGWIGETADTVRAKWPDIVQAFYDVRELAGQVAVKIGELWARWKELPTQVQVFLASAVALKALGLSGMFTGIASAIVGMIGPMLGLNAAMLSNPVGWFLAALVATAAVMAGLAIALVDFYKKNDEFRAKWNASWESMKKSVADFMVVWRRDLEPALRGFLPWAAQQVVYLFTGMAQAVKLTAWWVERLVGALRNLKTILDVVDWGDASARGTFSIPPIFRNAGGPVGFATGGPVGGYGSGDTVPAMLTPGEYVLNRRMVSQAGGVKQLEGWRAGLGGPGGIEVGQIIINNPIAETASQSLPKAVRKLAYVGVGA
jgi:molybdopterin-guanine dinucleotide biosynthesis protein A